MIRKSRHCQCIGLVCTLLLCPPFCIAQMEGLSGQLRARTKLAYIDKDGIYVVDLHSLHRTRVAEWYTPDPELSEPPFCSELDWSPDGKKIVFDYVRRFGGSFEELSEIAIVNVDGTDFYFWKRGSGASWAPDGRQLAYVSEWELLIAPTAGGAGQIIAEPHSQEAAWSPDGARIAYVQDLSFFVAHIDGSGRRHLTTRSVYKPAWSPDGKYIAFESNGAIYLLDVEKNVETRVVKKGVRPSWAPDGTKLLFISSAANRLYIVNPDGSDRKEVRNSEGALVPSSKFCDAVWSPFLE